MKKVKLVALILLLSFTVSIFTGCTFDDLIKIFNKKTSEDRLHIENECEAEIYDMPSNPGIVLDSLFNDETKNNIYIIENFDMYNAVFNEGALDVNFDEEIIYLHFYRRFHSDTHYIDEISIKDNVLHFYLTPLGLGPKDSINYYSVLKIGYFAVKMKKTNIDDVKFHMACDCKLQDVYS